MSQRAVSTSTNNLQKSYECWSYVCMSIRFLAGRFPGPLAVYLHSCIHLLMRGESFLCWHVDPKWLKCQNVKIPHHPPRFHRRIFASPIQVYKIWVFINWSRTSIRIRKGTFESRSSIYSRSCALVCCTLCRSSVLVTAMRNIYVSDWTVCCQHCLCDVLEQRMALICTYLRILLSCLDSFACHWCIELRRPSQ